MPSLGPLGTPQCKNRRFHKFHNLLIIQLLPHKNSNSRVFLTHYRPISSALKIVIKRQSELILLSFLKELLHRDEIIFIDSFLDTHNIDIISFGNVVLKQQI